MRLEGGARGIRPENPVTVCAFAHKYLSCFGHVLVRLNQFLLTLCHIVPALLNVVLNSVHQFALSFDVGPEAVVAGCRWRKSAVDCDLAADKDDEDDGGGARRFSFRRGGNLGVVRISQERDWDRFKRGTGEGGYLE